MTIKRMVDEKEKMGDQKHMNLLTSNSPVRRFTDSPTRPLADSPTRRYAHSPMRQVAMGEGAVTRAPHLVSSVGLGSCVAVTIYDTTRKIGGLAHIMLPDSSQICSHNSQYKCADTAIAALLQELQSKGAVRQNMVAKIVGGAQMFSSYDDSNSGVGKQNIMSIKRILDRERIPLIGEDIGGHHGRNIEFHLDSGKVIVRAMGKEGREI